MKKLTSVVLCCLLFFMSTAQTKSGSNKKLDSAKHTNASNFSFSGYLYIRIIDGIAVDRFFQVPDSVKVIRDFRVDYDSTVKSLGLTSLANESDRPTQLRIINTAITNQHKKIYEKTPMLPAWSKLVNLPVIINNKLYLPSDYSSLKKINIGGFAHFEYIDGTIASEFYGERMFFGAIKVRR